MKKFIALVIVIVLFLTVSFVLGKKKNMEIIESENAIVVEKEFPLPESAEQKQEENKDLYPNLKFGNWIPVPEEEIDVEIEKNYNGFLLEEYVKDNIETQLRVHNQRVLLSKYATFLDFVEDVEKATWVYDTPEDKNYLFSLIIGEEFNILQFRRDRNLETNECNYWLKVSNGEQEGWLFYDKYSSPSYTLYGEDFWTPIPVYFPYGAEKKLLHIRLLDSTACPTTNIYTCNHPFYNYAQRGAIPYSFKEEKRVKILAVTAEEDIEETNGKQWILVDDGVNRGWTTDRKSFTYDRGGPLFDSPEITFTWEFDMGA